MVSVMANIAFIAVKKLLIVRMVSLFMLSNLEILSEILETLNIE